MQLSFMDYCHITFALELIKLRAGILYTPEFECSRAQIDCTLTAIGTRDCLLFSSFNHTFYFIFISLFVCTSCTISL